MKVIVSFLAFSSALKSAFTCAKNVMPGGVVEAAQMQ